MESVYQHFERNLKDICRIAQKSGTKIIFSTVGSNLRNCPPFGSQHYLLAKTIFDKVEIILPEWVKRHKLPTRAFPTEAECARDLAFTDWDRYHIAHGILHSYIKRPPFSNQLYQNERVERMEKELNALSIYLGSHSLQRSAAQYRRAIEKAPTDWRLRWKYAKLLLTDFKNDQAAVEQYRWLRENLPHYHRAHAWLGLVLGQMGHLDEAIEHNLHAIRIQPFNPDAHYNLGLAYQLEARYDSRMVDKAIKHYSKTLLIKPDYAQAYQNLGALLDLQGRDKEAIGIYRKGLAVVPDNPDLHYNLGVLLAELGRRDEAIEELRNALQIDPNSTKTQKVLNGILEEGD